MDWRNELGDDALAVSVAELLVATADDADRAIDRAVPEVLRLLRERMKMDVVFVSEFTNGQRILRTVDQTPGQEVCAAGQADPLENTWCKQVVDGRLPEFVPDASVVVAQGRVRAPSHPIGTFLSTPVRLPDGEVYGTLCCFSFSVSDAVTGHDLKRLQYTAQLTGHKIQRSRQRAAAMALEPVAPPTQRR